jgi:Flp pilus assembly pilin Flp
MTMRTIVMRLLHDEEAQDLVEYALLVAFVGLAGLAAWLAIQNTIAVGYTNLDVTEQNLGAVTPPPQ